MTGRNSFEVFLPKEAVALILDGQTAHPFVFRKPDIDFAAAKLGQAEAALDFPFPIPLLQEGCFCLEPQTQIAVFDGVDKKLVNPDSEPGWIWKSMRKLSRNVRDFIQRFKLKSFFCRKGIHV